MSNEEKKRRELYRKRRKKWIRIQSLFVFIIAILSIVSFVTYNKLSETHYINYVENSKVSYNVYLKDNEYLDILSNKMIKVKDSCIECNLEPIILKLA